MRPLVSCGNTLHRSSIGRARGFLWTILFASTERRCPCCKSWKKGSFSTGPLPTYSLVRLSWKLLNLSLDMQNHSMTHTRCRLRRNWLQLSARTWSRPTSSQRRLKQRTASLSELHVCVYAIVIFCHCWRLWTSGTRSLETRQSESLHSSTVLTYSCSHFARQNFCSVLRVVGGQLIQGSCEGLVTTLLPLSFIHL